MTLPIENVWDYPSPPRLEPVPHEICVEFGGAIVARSTSAWRVLETSHPPVYYIPKADIAPGALIPASGSSYCEWKGNATYWTVVAGGKEAEKSAWSYEEPTPSFQNLQSHVAFYASRMDACLVGEERVTPQPGGFYGGWVTKNLIGPFKGSPGTAGW